MSDVAIISMGSTAPGLDSWMTKPAPRLAAMKVTEPQRRTRP
jgi:hypothetical protein